MVDVAQLNELPKAPELQAVGVAVLGDVVIISFMDLKGVVQSWAALNPPEAKLCAEQIARSAYSAEIKEDVFGLSSAMVERLRARMVISIEHLLKSEIINNNLDNVRMTAEKCVEIFLTEAT